MSEQESPPSSPDQFPASTTVPMSVFVPVPPAPQDSTATVVAKAIIEAVNDQPGKRVTALRNVWDMLWENDREGASPQEVFDALQEVQGGAGALVLLAGSLAVQDLENIANHTNTTFESLVGDAKYYTTPRTIIINPDGSVTVN